MIVVTKKGKINCYADYKLVGSFTNANVYAGAKKYWYNYNIGDQGLFTLLEGACRIDGDSIDVTFKNIRRLYDKRVCNTYRNAGLYAEKGGITYKEIDGGCRIKGTLRGLNGKNWDDVGAFDQCSASTWVLNIA